MKQEGALDRLRRFCGRIFPKLSSLFRAASSPPALAPAPRLEKETRGNHVVKTQWKPPAPPPAPPAEAASPAVSLAALELDIVLVDRMVRKLFGLLLHGGGEGAILSTRTPEGRAFIHQQLEELRAEKARYKEEKLALLGKLEPWQASERSGSMSATPPAPATPMQAAPAAPTLSAPAPARPPAPAPAPAPAAILPSPLEEDDHKAVERASALWMNTLTLGTYDAPRKAAELYAPDGVLWGSEVYSADSPLWGTGAELIRNTPGQIYAYYDCFARLPELRVADHTFSAVRVHGDFAAQDGTHTFAWKGRGGATVEMRMRCSLRYRREHRRGGGGWAIVEHCAFATVPAAAAPAEVRRPVRLSRKEKCTAEERAAEVARPQVTAARARAPRSGGGNRGASAVPDSFLLAEAGDHEKALARWKATLKWREESGANAALATAHPRFDFIKKNCPTYFHGKDKTGAVVYYEQLGKIDDKALRERGLNGKQMLWHYMYQMVYLWTVINPDDADRVTTVLDLRGVTLATATKADTVQFIKQCVTMMAAHYPERSTNLLLLSLPRWFDWIFRFIRPLLSESTKNKMTSCTSSSVYETLLSKIDNDQIPREYGGASEYALGEHPYEVAMRERALKVLAEKGVEMEPATG